jgi:cytochrome b561
VPGWQQRISGLSHGALYVLLVVVPLAGYVRVRAGGFPIESLDSLGISTFIPRSKALAETAQSVHYFGGLAIAAIIALHIGAALHHGLIKRDGIFSRMWPPFGPAKGR